MKKIIEADMIIIGAGVVGCAIARHMSIVRPEKKIVVLEKLSSIGMDASHKSSGILYYPGYFGAYQNANFLKSKLAYDGTRMILEYMKRNNFPILNCGMLIPISGWNMLDGFCRWSSALLSLIGQEMEGRKIRFKFLLSSDIQKIEPNIKAMGGIFIPDVWVINPDQLVYALWEEAMENGVEFFFDSPVTGVYAFIKHHCVSTTRHEFHAPVVINAAGLYADEIAKMAGFLSYKVYPWRGEYYEVVNNKSDLIKSLVYLSKLPQRFVGRVCLEPRIDGRLFISLSYPLIRKGCYNEGDVPTDVFLKSVKYFLPQLGTSDLRWKYFGIQYGTSNTFKEGDFVIQLDRKNPPMVNLIGIGSTGGFTCCMAIAKYVDWLLAKHFC